MDKKWKCLDCKAEYEGDKPPTACGCQGTKGFEEIVTKSISYVLKGDAYETIMKTMNDISSDMKVQKENNGATTERMEKYEESMKTVLAAQEELKKATVQRKGEFDLTSKDVQTIISNKFVGLDLQELNVMDTKDALLSEFQSKSDDIVILSAILQTAPKNLKYYQNFSKSGCYKAMTDAAGAGLEWIPTNFSSQLIELVNLELKIAALLPRITMPSDPYKLPGVSSHLKAFRSTGLGAGSDSPSKFKASQRGSRNVTFESELITVRTVYEGTLAEDSIIPILPMLKGNIAKAFGQAVEHTLINGDTTGLLDNTDMHGDVIDAQSPTKLWDGFRETAKDINAGSGTAVRDLGGTLASSGSDFRQARSDMGKYGVNPNNLIIVTGTTGYLNHFLGLRDIRTIDKYGSRATVLTGELAKIDATPVIVSEWEREDLNGSGVSGGASSGNTDSAFQIILKEAFMLGDRRRMNIETSKIQGTDSFEIWASMRMDFQTLQASSEVTVHNSVDFY